MATSTGGNINDVLFGGTPLEVAVNFVFDDEEFEGLFDTEVHSAVKEVIGAPTVTEWVQNLGYEEAKLVRLVENDKEVPLRDTDRPVEVFYELVDSGIWRRKADVQDKLVLKEKPCDQLANDVTLDDENNALNHGMPIPEIDVPDLPPVYRTPSLRGKSPIKEMFEGLTKLKSSEAAWSLQNDSKYGDSLQVEKSDLEHRPIAEENNKSEQDRAKGVDKKMGKNLQGRQTFEGGTASRGTLNSASTKANDIASENQRVEFEKNGKGKSVNDFAELSVNEGGEEDPHREKSNYVSTNRQNSPSENHSLEFEEKKEGMFHGFSRPNVSRGEDANPGSGDLCENSTNSTLRDAKEGRSVSLGVMSKARTHHETRSEFENTEVCDEIGLKSDFQEMCESNVVCKENKTTDNLVGHMVSDAAEKSEICIFVNSDINNGRIIDRNSDFSSTFECSLESSPSGKQYFRQEYEKGEHDTEYTERNENGLSSNPEVLNKPSPECKDKWQLGDSIVDERDLSATRNDYMSSKPACNDIGDLQTHLNEGSENQPRNIEIGEEKAQSDQCPVKVNVEIYEPDDIPVVGETIAMILPTSNNASTLTTLQTKSGHDTETSDDDDDASSVSSIESFMNKQDGSLPESEQMTAKPNSSKVSDGVLRNPDCKNEIHQLGGETKSDTIVVDGKHESVADKDENRSTSMETKSTAECLGKELKTVVIGHSPLNSGLAPSVEPSQQIKMLMEDVQQSKEKEASAADSEIRGSGSIAHAAGSLNKNRRRNAFRESALIKEVRMETIRRLSNERFEREQQQRMNEGQLEDDAAVGYGGATEQAIKMEHDALEETEALNKHETMHAASSPSEKGATFNSETELSITETHSLIDEHTTGNSSPIATAATVTTTAATTITEVETSTATSDATVHSENEVNPDVSPLRVPCSTCENLKERPWQVVKYKEMGTVLKQCTKIGKEASTGNRYDHICLTGVHLRIKHGEWEVTDGTSCHSESELTDSLEMMKSTTNQQDQNSIANKIVKEKQVKLKGGICCHWIPRRATGTWRVTRYTEENLSVEQSRNDDEEDWKIRAIPSPCFNETNDEDTETAEQEHVAAIDPVQAAQAVPVQSIFTEAKESLSRKLSTTMKGMLSHIPSQRPSSPSPVYMSLEMIEVRERLIVPLYRAVNQIRKHFVNAPPECLSHQVGDDSVNPSIGWLVRRDFCSALSAILLAGMKSDSAILKFIVSRSNQLNLFSLVKNVCRSCVEEPVLEIVVKVIEESPFLFDDSLRFRNFVCEALNWQNEAYTEKLLVTWFKTFVKLKHVIEKFYKKGSLWKLQGAEQAGLVEEVIIILENLNAYRFTLHADFEHKELAKRMEEEQMAFMLQRDPPEVDMEVMVFE